MNDPLKIAYANLLAPAGLDEQALQRILRNLLGQSVDSGDFYFESVRHEGWVLEDGIVKEGSYNHHKGVGIRAISGEKTGFAYSDDIQPHLLEQAAKAAKSIAHHGQEKNPNPSSCNYTSCALHTR